LDTTAVTSSCDSGCSQTTDEGLRHLGHVTTLDLRGCGQITDVGLAHLRSVRQLSL
jgi:hypothetical protein